MLYHELLIHSHNRKAGFLKSPVWITAYNLLLLSWTQEETLDWIHLYLGISSLSFIILSMLQITPTKIGALLGVEAWLEAADEHTRTQFNHLRVCFPRVPLPVLQAALSVSKGTLSFAKVVSCLQCSVLWRLQIWLQGLLLDHLSCYFAADTFVRVRGMDNFSLKVLAGVSKFQFATKCLDERSTLHGLEYTN